MYCCMLQIGLGCKIIFGLTDGIIFDLIDGIIFGLIEPDQGTLDYFAHLKYI